MEHIVTKICSRRSYIRLYKILIKRINWRCLFWEKAKIYYEERTGRPMNYREPQDINEKLMWLTRYWRDPLKTKCADKYMVREYVNNCGLGNILVPLIKVYDQAEDINFDDLPVQFVLKCNHGCGFNIIVPDKRQVDFDEIKDTLNRWMNSDYSNYGYEIHYKDINRKIVCEHLLSETAPMEYQFWCINGQVDTILACRKNFDGTYDAWSFSTEWNQVRERIGESEATNCPPPLHLDDMLNYSKTLSSPFPFVRVDFYEVSGVVYFAELTFTPSANVLSKYKREFLDRLGRKLVLPKRQITSWI